MLWDGHEYSGTVASMLEAALAYQDMHAYYRQQK
jgi:hypothetical protein